MLGCPGGCNGFVEWVLFTGSILRVFVLMQTLGTENEFLNTQYFVI